MTQILAERRIQLTKSLGQNFLHDANQLRRIVDAAELTQQDQVLEIGPGLGPLTAILLARAREVLAIEKDARLVEVLREEFREALSGESGSETASARLELVHDDALQYIRRQGRDWSRWKLVSNLPYSAASTILVELAGLEGCPERVAATLQIEVAKRLMAQAGDPDYGILTLLVQVAYEPQGWFKIPASCFFPAPEVDSACVSLVRRRDPVASGVRSTFVRVVKRSFSQRRKMMLKLLKQDWDARLLEDSFRTARIGSEARAETISLEQFLELAQTLHKR